MLKKQLTFCYNIITSFLKGKNLNSCQTRCVNTNGRPGKNMPCDLFMEHLNTMFPMT